MYIITEYCSDYWVNNTVNDCGLIRTEEIDTSNNFDELLSEKVNYRYDDGTSAQPISTRKKREWSQRTNNRNNFEQTDNPYSKIANNNFVQTNRSHRNMSANTKKYNKHNNIYNNTVANNKTRQLHVSPRAGNIHRNKYEKNLLGAFSKPILYYS